jgi:hypothetical protein
VGGRLPLVQTQPEASGEMGEGGIEEVIRQ